jgi:predicted RNase H-like HicB family nuclease
MAKSESSRRRRSGVELRELLERKYPMTLSPDPDGGFVVEFRDLPGCVTQAETVEDALRMADDAREAWIRVAYEHGDPVPPASADATYSGKLLVRMPKSLHRRLAERSRDDDVSQNQEVVRFISAGLEHPREKDPNTKRAKKTV